MRLRLKGIGGAPRLERPLVWLAVLAWLALPAAAARAVDTPLAPPAAAAAPAMGGEMNSAGWLEHIAMGLESEAMSDVHMAPSTPGAIEREWRSFASDGTAVGALADLGWVVLAACIAVFAQELVARGLGRRMRRRLQARLDEASVHGLLLLLLYDVVGLAVFAGVFVYSRHWLIAAGVTMNFVLFAANVLIRWRIAALVVTAVLRPNEPVARLIELPDDEARRLARFLSATILAVVALIGFGRYSLMDADSGASHVIGLGVAVMVCGLYALIVFRARGAAEALIRGYPTTGLIAIVRSSVAHAWLPIALTAVAGLMVFFVFGLSLGLLSYYHAVVSTLGVWFLLLVFERLTERGWQDVQPVATSRPGGFDRLVATSFRSILRVAVVLVAAVTLAWIWIDAIKLPAAEAAQALRATVATGGTLFVAYLTWEVTRLAIDRHLHDIGGGPSMPGMADDDAAAPASRLQTVLPLLRAAFGVVIAVLAGLIVLSRLGIDTAPLIAGAGVFGLAVSFGSQSLVRDIISGLFYMWDDAFRVGEYIDTGRLKGTVETLGIRSVKLRHQNGPLHTIPYGQLGAVTNLSRDFATIKFNLRMAPGTDIELVRKTVKQIGIAMQDNPEMAAEIMLPLKLQGIAEVVDNAVVLRFKFTARPVKPNWVQREYLKTMYRVFAEKGIEFAVGALTLQSAPRSAVAVAAAEGDPAPPVLSEALTIPAPLSPASRVA